MGRFARSWHLTKTSWSVLMHDRELLWMPILSFLATVISIAAVSGVGFFSGIWPETQNADGSVNLPGAALVFALYLVLAFIALFFNAAVVAGASERLAGGDPTVGSALRAAGRKAGRIFLWSIVVATVNIILQAIRERAGAVGQIFASLGGMAWNLATYFMVPILLFEDHGIGKSVKRSGSLFKQTWGETVMGQAGLGLAGLVVTVAVAAAGFGLLMLLGSLGTAGFIAGIAILVLGVATVAVVFATLQGVYKAALYRYATTGKEGMGFTSQDLGGAFHAKGM